MSEDNPPFKIISREEFRKILKDGLKSLEEEVNDMVATGHDIVDKLDEELVDAYDSHYRIFYWVHGEDIGYKMVKKEYGFRNEEDRDIYSDNE
jgi:hypothetical protein